MTARVRILFICILLVTLSGCANRPVFTVEVYASPTSIPAVADPLTATASLEPMLPATTATPVTESASLPTSTVTPFMPPDFSPILYGKKYDANMFFLVLGGVQGETWFTPDQAAAQFGGEWDYDVHTFTRGSFQVRGHVPEYSPVSGGYYSIRTDSSFDEFGMVGVVHGWPVRQASGQELVSDNQTYEQVVMDWLMAEGVSAPTLGALHIFRVDLEGDAVDEVFISATHLDESRHTTKAGDYSIVLMRKVIGNSTVTIPLAADVYRSQQLETTYPSTYSIGNFIDLNRDGTLEVVVDFERWEGFGARVYQVDGQTVIERLK